MVQGGYQRAYREFTLMEQCHSAPWNTVSTHGYIYLYMAIAVTVTGCQQNALPHFLTCCARCGACIKPPCSQYATERVGLCCSCQGGWHDSAGTRQGRGHSNIAVPDNIRYFKH